MHVLSDPFVPTYMQRAWLELALLSFPAGVLGVFVLLRRLAFATHALGVGTFPGVVTAFGLGVSAFAGGAVAALSLAGLMALLQRRRDLDAPAATGLLLAGALALGSLLVSDVFSAGERVDSLLFGSLFGVTGGDLARSAGIAVASVGAFALLGRPWLLVAFDRENAPVLGFTPLWLDLALLALVAMAVVSSVDAVGSLLVSSLFVVPPALSRLFVRRLVPLAAASVASTLALSTAGLIVSFHTGAPPGATIAAFASGAFVLVLAARALMEPRRRRLALLGASTAAVLALAACGGGSSAGAQSGKGAKLRVVATTTQVADWAREVGGTDVTVTQILQPNVDPHDFEPTPDDVGAVANAGLVLASGAGLDAWIDDAVTNAGGGATLVEVAPTADLRKPALATSDRASGSGGNTEGDVDPHFWHDPTLVAKAVQTIADAMAKAAPDHAQTFRANAARYVRELAVLDADLERTFDAVPASRRKMVTDHDAFGYLAARYGITVVGAAIPSTSTAAEPSARATAELIDTIRQEGVHAVFSESSVDPKLIDQIAGETGATVIPDLYGDTLGPKGSDALTYIAMMRHNARVLVAGFNR